MVELCNSPQGGTSALAAFGYGLYALVCFLFDLKESYRAGILSIRLMEKYNATIFTTKLVIVYFLYPLSFAFI